MQGLEQFNLESRVALITGASSHGIGSETAKLLAANGAKVFLTARREDKLADMARVIESEGGTVGYKATDVSSEEDCKAAIDACVEKFGRLDILVLAAGISGVSVSGGMEAVFDTENWRNVLGINLDGVFFMIKHSREHLAKNGVGSIIQIGSLAALVASGSAPYTASKGAMMSMQRLFAKMLAPENIRVNTIYPGFIETDMTQGAVDNEQYCNMILAKIPLKRIGKAEDCAHAALYLASDASSFMTGQGIVLDGGQIA